MVKEFDLNGIPVVHVTTLATLAKGVGSTRIVAGKAITNPTGDYELGKEDEYKFRRKMVKTCLEAFKAEVSEPTIFYS